MNEMPIKGLSGKYDKYAAYLDIFAGVGGDDAKDWAQMLLRMYIKYAQKKNWKIIQVDDNTLEIVGEYVYGHLKKESGVHRLVRISPFSQKKLRHTSFALVEVTPVIPAIEIKQLQIPEKDLRVDTMRSSGPGGQNVNKRETAVRVTHIATGLSVMSQAERSQIQNKEKALSLLRAKLFHLIEKHQTKEFSELRVKVKPEWGNQIRNYVMNPYHIVKDTRTKVETTQVEKVLEGDLDKFVEAELNLP